MNSGDFIQGKQRVWASRKRIPLQGSKGEKGAKNYTHRPEDNLFDGSLSDAVLSAFGEGAGGELRGDVPKMSALHSSSALGVNLFAYWLNKGELVSLARLLEIPSVGIKSASFEDCFPVCDDWQSKGFTEPPHLDFAFRYDDGARVGIECKLFEPYGRLGHMKLSEAYLALAETWDDIPRCRALAEQAAVGDLGFHRLGASQLIKHILGLKHGAKDGNFRLVYLYFDAPGKEGAEHRKELELIQEAIAGDPIRVVPLSVQEFILRLCERARAEHMQYVDYLAERYL